jgi:Arc/MetJ family transcription regulator
VSNAVYLGVVTRANTDGDDAVVAKTMSPYRRDAETGAADFALRTQVRDAMTREEVLEMQGTGWEGDLDAMRQSTPPIPG